MNAPAAAAVSAASATRRFLARSGREALRLVREAFGEDAVIVSNRMTGAGVEIVASAPAAVPVPVPVQPPTPVPASAAPAARSEPGDAVLQELLSMRSMIEEQLAGRVWTEEQRRDPLRGHLLRLLLGAGFSTRLARATLAELPAGLAHAQGLMWLKDELARRLPAITSDDGLLGEGGVYALVGPTGVGKTTTTAKLAARCVVRFGPQRLALVTTDSFRIGAYEQLRIYGEILGVPVHAVKDAGDLRLVLQHLRDKHVVLIDTVGMSQRDRALTDQIAMLRDAPRPVRRLLLLNATSHGDTLDEVVQAYQGQDLAGCILTKADEATHPGAAIDTVIRHGLPVHYVSAGQKVPEHLELPQPAQLVEGLFRADSRTALFVPGEVGVHEHLAPLRNEADVALAQSQAQRLQAQCRQLVRALAHDAQEVAGHASTLAAAGIGFEQAQALWREMAGQPQPASPAPDLAGECAAHVLATRATDCVLLLSDLNGLPVAAASREQVQAREDFGRQVVMLLDAPPLAEGEVPWVARAFARQRVRTEYGDGVKLAGLAQGLAFDEPQAMQWRGRCARRSIAHTRVALSTDGPLLRLVVERIADARTGELLAQRFVLASAALVAQPAQVLQWNTWRTAARPCLRLLEDARQQLAAGAFAGAAPVTSLRLAQAVTTVWRLHQAAGEWAAPVRALLAQLAGRRIRAGRGVPAPVLFEGLGKLCVLLDALAATP